MMGAMAGMNCLLRGTIGEIAATQDGARADAGGARRMPRSRQGRRLSSRGRRPAIGSQTMLTEPGSVNSASMRQDLEAGPPHRGRRDRRDMLRRAREFGSKRRCSAAYCRLQVHENRVKAAQ